MSLKEEGVMMNVPSGLFLLAGGAEPCVVVLMACKMSERCSDLDVAVNRAIYECSPVSNVAGRLVRKTEEVRLNTIGFDIFISNVSSASHGLTIARAKR